MNRRGVATVLWICLATGCFIMAGLSAAGVVSRAEPNGRVIFGIGWTLIGIGWLGRYYFARKKWRGDDEENRRV